MNIEIDHLRLRLPASLAPRAAAIVEAIAAALGEIQCAGAQRVGRLAIPPVRLDPAASDIQIGAAIARQIGLSMGVSGRHS